MGALEHLFNGEPPKKTGSTPKPSQTKSEPKPKKTEKSDDGKVTCSECGDEVWKFQQNGGVCKPCQKKSKTITKAEPKRKAAPPVKKAKTANREKGLKSTDWHDKEATFPQTSRLKKATGLKTWDLETPLNRLQASTMISTINEDGEEGLEAVTSILIEQFGCEVYVRPGDKVKAAPKQQAAKPLAKMTKDELIAQMLDMQEALNNAA